MNKKKVDQWGKKELYARAVIAGSSSDAVLAQEAHGQRSFVASTTLPTKGPKEALQAAGVVFGEVVENDPLFQYVQFPEGWKKEGTDHDMWSYLVDAKGNRRASIFYKAAFYDRDAFFHVERRFSMSTDYERKQKENILVVEVRDGEKVIYATTPINMPAQEKGSAYWRAVDKIQAQADIDAKRWLVERYPNWEDASAYWEEIDGRAT